MRTARSSSQPVSSISRGVGKGVSMHQAAQQSIDTSEGYAQAAMRLSGLSVDPYEAAAQEQIELGRRFPEPYAAAAAEAAHIRAINRTAPTLQLGPQGSIFSSASVAGQRVSHHGAPGTPLDVLSMPVQDARRAMGFVPTGARDAGFSQKWDRDQASARRLAGRIQTGVFEQAIPEDRPWLSLRMESENDGMVVEVTAGVRGGADFVRRFALGGGFTAAFLLEAYTNVKVELIAGSANATVQFAWVTRGMQPANLDLYLPVWYATGTVVVAETVPEGAYECFVSAADPLWQWLNPAIVGWGPIAGVGVAAANRVLGSQFTMNGGAGIPGPGQGVVWVLRPL